MQKNPTSTTQTATLLPAMLEGAYATSLENRIAQMNNQLAREGRTSNDPLVRIMLALRHDLKVEGCTFERQIPGMTATVAAPAPVMTTAPVMITAPTPKVRTSSQGAPKATTKTATTVTVQNIREIKPEQLEALQVPGSENEVAIYGTDKNGRVLAPFGVKNDGTPMRRRGRVAAATVASDEPSATMPEPRVIAAPVADDDLDFDVDAVQTAATTTTETVSEEFASDDDEIAELLKEI